MDLPREPDQCGEYDESVLEIFWFELEEVAKAIAAHYEHMAGNPFDPRGTVTIGFRDLALVIQRTSNGDVDAVRITYKANNVEYGYFFKEKLVLRQREFPVPVFLEHVRVLRGIAEDIGVRQRRAASGRVKIGTVLEEGYLLTQGYELPHIL